MNDPHVEYLKYHGETPAHITYKSPTPLNGETPEFKYRLEQDSGLNVLTVEMKKHYALESDACAAVEPFLKDWQVWAALHGNMNAITFRLKDAHVVDQAATPGDRHVFGRISMGVTLKGIVDASVVAKDYPA